MEEKISSPTKPAESPFLNKLNDLFSKILGFENIDYQLKQEMFSKEFQNEELQVEEFTKYLDKAEIKRIEDVNQLESYIKEFKTQLKDCGEKNFNDAQTRSRMKTYMVLGGNLEDIKIDQLEESPKENENSTKSANEISNEEPNYEDFKTVSSSFEDENKNEPDKHISSEEIRSVYDTTIDSSFTREPSKTYKENRPNSTTQEEIKRSATIIPGLTAQNSQEPLSPGIYKIPALNLPSNELSSQTATVTVSNPNSDPKVYTLITSPLNWTVQRKIEDFTWFQNILTIAYPGVYIPPPLPTNVGKSKEDSLYKFKAFLQRFMNDIISHPLLKRSPIVHGFLKEDNKDKYKLFKRQSKKLKTPEKVELMFSVDNVSYCDISTSNDFSKNLNDYVHSAQTIQKNIKRLSDQFEEQLKNAVATIEKLAYSFQELAKIQEVFPQNKIQQEIYISLSQTFESCKNSDLERVKSVKEHINTFFKYSYNEVAQLKDLIKERENWNIEYVKNEKKVMGRKEKLWEQGDALKWWNSSEEAYMDIEKLKNDKELAFSKMLQKETQQLETIRNFYGYFNYKLQEEALRFFQNSAIRNCKNFKEFADQEASLGARDNDGWKELAEKLQNLEAELNNN
ncbi:unnamed protein product [Blepharisma stoltei]|uniref:PX domain-containing protein n=1 Tax=Blepharisma stoltei TaxID=1481888 RepID=A0AAU9J7J5_9CILI|nr:unnamed protein product [Blepharisma stoltei]